MIRSIIEAADVSESICPVPAAISIYLTRAIISVFVDEPYITHSKQNYDTHLFIIVREGNDFPSKGRPCADFGEVHACLNSAA